jgi:hypothetical protein
MLCFVSLLWNHELVFDSAYYSLLGSTSPLGLLGLMTGVLDCLSLHYCKRNRPASRLQMENEPPNGVRYPLVGGTRGRHFDGTDLKPRKRPENAASPTRRVVS